MKYAILLAASLQAAVPTYYPDVQPVLERNCTVCHSAGQVAPFRLDNYADAAKRAKMIAAVTSIGRMPIWKPEPGFGSFHDERRLTKEEIATLAAWAKAGAPQGKPRETQLTKTESAEKPDLLLRMPQAIPVAAEGPDQFICSVIEVPIDADQWVRKVEFHPGNPRVVHHSLFFLMDAAKARQKAGAKGYYTCFGGPGGLPQGALGGWAPGAFSRELPTGTARQLKKGLAIVMQQHYHPDGKPELDQSELAVYFAKGPVERPVNGLAVRTRDIHIPAGDAHHVIKADLELPVDVSLIGVTPHMHYVGKEMKVVAIKPDGARVPLIWIKDWDFNWQGQYRYSQGVDLPAGTRLEMETIYDNSAGNPRNPSSPPKAVDWGEQTTNEMAICFFEYTSPVKNAQGRILLSMMKQFVKDWF